MAAAQILATASTAASSSDITVAAGTPLAVSLRGVTDGQARVLIELKDEAAVYAVIGELRSHAPNTRLDVPGIYRFTRVAGATCGVFSG